MIFKYQTVFLLYLAMFNNVIKEFSTRDIFHDHENICWGADHLIPAMKAHSKLVNVLGVKHVFKTHTA